MGVPGTLGEKPAGLASGEPPGAQVVGGWAPKAAVDGGWGVALPGRLRNRAVASWARAPVSSGAAGGEGSEGASGAAWAAASVGACAGVVLKTASPVVRDMKR